MKKIIIALIIIVGLGFIILLNTSSDSQPAASFSPVEVQSLADAHGFAIDKNDENTAYIANHSGLYRLTNEQKLERISEEQHDFMGFTPHPTENNTYYVSGHPKRGGNLGVMKSVDGGQTYQKISDGLNGPVDFHAMTISKANPSILYGTYAGQLQRSTDSGANWEFATMPNGASIISLSTDNSDENKLYASTDKGLFASNNRGDSWDSIYADDTVIALTFNPADNTTLIASFATNGLQQSNDGGKTWHAFGGTTFNSPVRYIEFYGDNPDVVYVMLQDLSIHKSTDKGASWKIMYR